MERIDLEAMVNGHVVTNNWCSCKIKFFDIEENIEKEVTILAIDDIVISHVEINGESYDRIDRVFQREGLSADDAMIRCYLMVKDNIRRIIETVNGRMNKERFMCHLFETDVEIKGMDALSYFEYILESEEVD